ncbi:MAG: aminopeptidase [Thermoplasmatota archaeon]
MTKFYKYELQKAARSIIEDSLNLEKDETLIITADTESDERVVDATASAAFSVGAKPLVIWNPAPLGVGKNADPMLPVDALTAVLKEADAWIEYNNKWLLYSTPWERATDENEKLRYLCLVSSDVDMMVRMIGRVDREILENFMKDVTDLTKKAKHMRVTTPAGTDLEFDNNPDYPIDCDAGDASTPGMYFLAGQIAWTPELETINGTIVFDGSIDPPLGLLEEPVEITIEDGKVVDIDGGKEAREYEEWLNSFDNPNMFRLAHISYGFNPGAKLTGQALEDERIWGSTEWGLGYMNSHNYPPHGVDAPSHTDGICLDSSVWLDGEQLLDKGSVVHPELKKYEDKFKNF